ncbi:YkuS family protein [Calorimonas adulescens]|uniref:YkuS family protein n=1 Tax=Calorimonas adulescens TaxID=2606906 RepID=A0A5D8QGB5_9THEO|nr:YkuS family protein [Calorimonas adulescens]TZE82563.1 YkuS family protein [Calorimonas adulescens]
MAKRVAVESSLTDVKNYLSQKGYEVIDISDNSPESISNVQYDAIVATGLDSNTMGMEDIRTQAPVIQARGLTVEDVYKRLEDLKRRV